MSKLTVNQDYPLVNAKYKLNVSEIKFILTAISQIDSKNDEVLKEYTIKVTDLEKKLQVEQNTTRLKQFAKKLMSKPLEVPTEDGGFIVFNWFSKIRYYPEERLFRVRIDEDLKPYLLQLKERFVSYHLQYIIPLTSIYSIRIYQLLKEYEKLTKRYFDVDELQDILQVPKSYRIYNRFKEKVLKVAQAELKEHTDIYFTFDEEKTGKKVTRLIFRIYKSRSENKEQPTIDDMSRYKGKTIYYNGKDRQILNVWEVKEEKGYVLVQLIDDAQDTITDKIHIAQLEKMIEYAENRNSALF